MNAPSENLSLRWISPELDESVNIARRSFEAYLADPSASNSAGKLASSVNSTQAAANIFAEVDMLAAAGIAIEIAALLEALQTGGCENPRDCYQVIIGGFNQLFNYLALTRKLGSEEPAALLAVRSELRAVAGQPLNLPDEFFALNTPSAWSLPAPADKTGLDWAPLSTWIDTLSEHLAAIDANPDHHRAELQRALEHCETFSAEKWISDDGGLIRDCCLAIKLLLKAAYEDGQRVSAGVKRCILRCSTALSLTLKALFEGGTPDNAQHVGEALEELLFFCSITGGQDAVVSKTFKHYGIEKAIKASASGVLLRLGTPDVETIDLVLAGLFEDIESLQNALRESVENSDGAEAFAAHENMVARLYYTAKLAGQDELYPVLDRITQGFKNISGSGVLEASSVEKIVEGVFELEALIEKMRSGSYRDKGELTVLEQVNTGLNTLTTALSLMASEGVAQEDKGFASTLEDFAKTIEELLAVTRFIATGLIATTLEAIQDFYTQRIAAPLRAGTTDGVQVSCEQLSKAISMVQGSVASCRLSRHYVVETGLYEACALLGVELVQAQASELEVLAATETDIAASNAKIGGWEAQALDAEIDDDIAEIFLEEAAEVLETLQEQLPLLSADESRDGAIGEVRRAYHTLKGSGRMAGAEHVGEAAWAIESMLNRVLDKSISLDSHRIALIQEATAYMPVVIDNFQQRVLPYPPALESLVGRAEILSNDASAEVAIGESLDLLAALETGVVETGVAETAQIDSTANTEHTVDHEPAVEAEVDGAAAGSDAALAPTHVVAGDGVAGDGAAGDGVSNDIAPQVWVAQALDAEIDDEIAEIFLEEAAEVLETLQEQLPLLSADESREAAIGEVRRAYHTLKGSGRMAGAEHVGESAWAIESMLNRVLDKSVNLDAHRIALIEEATAYMPVVIDNFQQRVLPYPPALESLVSRAEILSNDASAEVAIGESLDLLAALVSTPVDSPATETTLDTSAIDTQAVEKAKAEEEAKAKAAEEAKAKAAEEAKAKAEEEAKAKAEEEAKAKAEEEAKAKAEEEAKAKAEEEAKAKAEEEAKAKAEEEAKAKAAEEAKAKAAEEAKAKAAEEAKAKAAEEAKAKAAEEAKAKAAEEAKAKAAEEAKAKAAEEAKAKAAEEAKAKAEEESEAEAKAKIEEEASLAAAAMVAVDSEREALREIFYEEATLQLALIEKYLESAAQNSGIVPGEEVERACHTLLGGARIAGVQPIADLMAPAEVLAGSMRRDNHANSNQEKLFVRAAAWLKSFLEGEPESADATIQLVDDFNIAMDSAISEIAESDADHNNLLALSGLILDGRQFLRTWRAQSGVPSQFDTMVAELCSIADAAASLEPVQTLVEAMLALYRSSALIGLHYHSYSALMQAHLDLENMLDRIAAGQNPESSASVAEMLVLVEQDEALLKKIAEGEKNVAGDTQLDTDDAMDAEIVEIFLEESQDLIEEVEASVLKWLSDQTEMSYLESLLRPLHTIKGGARMAGLEEVGNLCHEFESLLESASNQDVKINAGFFKKVSKFLADLIAKFAAITNPGVEANEEAEKKPNEQEEDKRNTEVVRVAASLLEHLVNLAGETSISRSLIEEKTNDFARSIDDIDSTVERLKEQLRRLEIETEAQINFRKEKLEIEGQEGFDPLEMDRYSQLQQLSKSLVESASDLKDLKSTLKDKTRDIETLLLQQARVNTELQESLMRTRTVPLSRAIVPRLRRTIRQVSGELDKPVTFDIGSSDGELDRSVIERMVAPLEHVLRNAIDHGIEPASVREKAGKPETGSIRLDIQREGSDVVLKLSDDGKGVDVAAVRKKAIALGLMQEEDQLDDDEIKQFIMSAGFSTASKVTQISGRGVGMDVVQKEIHELGGAVELVSEQGVGTTFVFRLPFTVSMNRALLVGAGGETLAVPLDSIEGIVRVSPYELEEYYGDAAIDFMYAGQRYDFRYLGSLINGSEPQYSSDMVGALPVLLVRAGEKLVAFQVDRLLGSREIVVKSLGPQFARIEGVSGATVLGDGSVVMIADLASLVRNEDALTSAGRDTIMPKAESRDCPLVMVVDDSVTVRKVTTRLLEREGFEVITAKDGLDAIEKLEEVTPDIMLCDIEMPRLDGFEVVTRVRNEARLANMPIVMISSRTGDKHTERAISLGANDFLGKPYQDKNLLSTINCHLSVRNGDRAVNQ